MRAKLKKNTRNSRQNTQNDIRVFDATAQNWVDRFCPVVVRPYLRLSRLDRPIGAWLLFIPCLWGGLAASFTSPNIGKTVWIITACAIGSILMRGAGCTWNDITDRQFDGQVKRTATRPLPAGQITPRAAFIWMIAQTALAGVILLTFNWFAVLIGVASLLPVLIYPFAKRWTWWPQVFLGVAFNWGILLAWAAQAQALPVSAFILYLSAIFWTLFYDTIYAFQDTEDDALLGIKSTARLFGNRAKPMLFVFALASTALLTLAVFLLPIGVTPHLALYGGIAGFATHLSWQLYRLDTRTPALCLNLFKKNRTAGLIVVFALLLSLALQYIGGEFARPFIL